MRRYKRIQNNAYRQSLLIMVVIFIADVFSFFIVKGIFLNVSNGYHISTESVPIKVNKFLKANGEWGIKDFSFCGTELDNDDKNLNAPVSIGWIADSNDLKSQMILSFQEPDLTNLNDSDKEKAIKYLKALTGTNFTLKSVKEDKNDDKIFVSNTIFDVDDNGKVTFSGSCVPFDLNSMTKNYVGTSSDATKNLVLSISVPDNSSLSDAISNIFKLEGLNLRFKIKGTVCNIIPSNNKEKESEESNKNSNNQSQESNIKVVDNDKNYKEDQEKKWIWEGDNIIENSDSKNGESTQEYNSEEDNFGFLSNYLKNKNENKNISNIIDKSNLKETSENLIIDIMPLLLIGCVVIFKRKELFEFKYKY